MLSIVGISILIIITKITSNNSSLVPILGIFAAAAFRIIPSLNSMMKSIQLVRFSSSTINLLSNEFNKIEISNNTSSSQSELSFNKSISVSNLNFKFDSSNIEILKNINFKINKGETVGFIGSSGSGKSTLVDIVIGLHKPKSGSVNVDYINIKNNELAWRKKIGYIPQSIYIIDDTLRRNIAFAIPENEIDDNRVQKAIDAAQLTDFVNKLPEKTETCVGEKGVRISGGQRQRIGIARALYNDPEVLILDEATSALDLNTESQIMQTVLNMKGNKTILIVAHRLKTLENCDRIIVIEEGVVKEEGEPSFILNKYK
jgi:ABC-type multidrug transport system fused ATPase/permease subunit